MLIWMCGVKNVVRIRNERDRGTTKLGEIFKKVQESRFRVVRTCNRNEKRKG